MCLPGRPQGESRTTQPEGSPVSPAGAAQPPNRLQMPIDQVLAAAPAGWARVVAAWAASPDGRRLRGFLAARQAAGATVYPADPLRALALTPPEAVQLVVLGQDPYHGPGQAEGLAFSVPAGVKLPPSLRNILAELAASLGVPARADGHLGGWARQGVLLLNTVLTVEDGRPASHARQGWEALTDAVVARTASDPHAKIYLLWGAHAQAKAALVQALGAGRHRVLQANHPSPLSARRPPLPFIGCGHFASVQQQLAAWGRAPIDWSA